MRRVDKEIAKGKAGPYKGSVPVRPHFVKASVYLTPTAKSYLLKPLGGDVGRRARTSGLEENNAVEAARRLTAGGHPGRPDPGVRVRHYAASTSSTWDIAASGLGGIFYANLAAQRIPKMVEMFDDEGSSLFVEVDPYPRHAAGAHSGGNKTWPAPHARLDRVGPGLGFLPGQEVAGSAHRSGPEVGVLEVG